MSTTQSGQNPKKLKLGKPHYLIEGDCGIGVKKICKHLDKDLLILAYKYVST